MLHRRRFAATLLGTSLLALLLAATPFPTAAQQARPTPTTTQTPPPTPTAAQPTPTEAPALRQGDADFYSLVDLGRGEITLRGPYSTADVNFALPATWVVGDDAAVQVDMSVFITGLGALSANGFGGLLTVSLNDTQLGALSVDSVGSRAVQLAIPASALSARPDGRNRLTFELNTGLTCDDNQQMNVVLRSGSGILLPHTAGALPTGLAQLPRPISQRSLEPDTALLVVPDAPKAEELQAALTTAAAFGRTTNGQLALSLVTAGALTDEQLRANHLIFVGGPAAFPQLAKAALPAALGGEAISVDGIGADDGVLQMVASPWNPGRALLSVSGNSPAGVVKAAQAVSNNEVRSYVQPNLALVEEVRQMPVVAEVAADRTFADLGYAQRTVTDRSARQLEYRFDVPSGQVPDGEVSLRLSYSRSALMDLERSGAEILLNDQPVGSIPFSESSSGLSTAQIILPPGLIRGGTNYLTVAGQLTQHVACADRDRNELWFTVWPDSLVHLPLSAAKATSARPFSLASYPSEFVSSPDLASTAFVLSPEDPAGWASAAQIAYDLGRRSDGALAMPAAVLGDAPEAVRAASNLILVGRASRLPLVGELGERLPAPFAAGSDYASERGTRVQYRPAPDASIGYLQALSSPWSAQHGVLAVLGSDDAAVAAAAAALVTPSSRSRLATGLLIVDGPQLISGVQVAIPPTPAPPVALTSTPVTGQPGWLMPVAIGAGVLIVAVLAVILLGALRRRPTHP